MPTTKITIHGPEKWTVNDKTSDKLTDAEKLEVDRFMREWIEMRKLKTK